MNEIIIVSSRLHLFMENHVHVKTNFTFCDTRRKAAGTAAVWKLY